MVETHAVTPVWRTIERMNVLSTRRIVSGQMEIQAELTALRRSLETRPTGAPIARMIGQVENGIEVEVAFPVEEPCHVDGFEVQCLPRFHALTAIHRGPLESSDNACGVRDVALEICRFANDGRLLLGDDPLRYVYLEGAERHGDSTSSYVTEVQVPYHLPFWLESLDSGCANVAGGDAAKSIMAGSESLAKQFDGDAAAQWVEGAVHRLESAVTDERARAAILNGCAHHYLISSAEHLRRLAEEEESLRALISRIDRDSVLGGRYTLDETGEAPLLIIERSPARPEAFASATAPEEKRYQACFCPLVRDALREGRTLPRSFCHCSAGWYVQEWEPILGAPPRVDLLATMLEGADVCRFAVHLPPGSLDRPL